MKNWFKKVMKSGEVLILLAAILITSVGLVHGQGLADLLINNNYAGQSGQSSTYTLYGRTTLKNGTNWDDLNGIVVQATVMDLTQTSNNVVAQQNYTSGPVGGSFTFSNLPLPKTNPNNFTAVMVTSYPSDYKYVGYTLCYNTTTCHNQTPTFAWPNILHNNVNDNGFVDLWFHFEKKNQVTVNLSADPETVVYNGSTALHWTSTGANYCWGYDGGTTGWYGEKPINGSKTISGLTKDTTFKLVCRLQDGVENEKSVTVKVQNITNVVGTLREVRCDDTRDLNYRTITASGDASDPDTPENIIRINFYLGNSKENSGTYIGNTTTIGQPGRPFSFQYEVSKNLKSSIYAYAIDSQSGQEKYIGMFNYDCRSQENNVTNQYVVQGNVVNESGQSIGTGQVLLYVNDGKKNNISNTAVNPFSMNLTDEGPLVVGIDATKPVAGKYEVLGYTMCANSTTCHNSQSKISKSSFDYTFAAAGYIDVRWYVRDLSVVTPPVDEPPVDEEPVDEEPVVEPPAPALKINLSAYDAEGDLSDSSVTLPYNSDLTLKWRIDNMTETDSCSITNDVDSQKYNIETDRGTTDFTNLTKTATFTLQCNNDEKDSIDIIVESKDLPEEDINYENLSGKIDNIQCDNSKWLDSVFTRYVGVYANLVKLEGTIDDVAGNEDWYRIGFYLDGDNYIGSTYSQEGQFEFSFNPLLRQNVAWNGLPDLTGDVYVYAIDQEGNRLAYLDRVEYDCDLHEYSIPEKQPEMVIKNLTLDFGVQLKNRGGSLNDEITVEENGTEPMLSWTSQNTVACVAGGDWGGRNDNDSGKKLSGSEILYDLTPGHYEYILTCRGANETSKVEKRVVVEVTASDKTEDNVPAGLEDYAYQIVNQSADAAMKPGEKKIFWVTLENVGRKTWNNNGTDGETYLINYPVGQDSPYYTKYDNNGQANWISPSKIRRGDSPLAKYGDEMSFGFLVTAPVNPNSDVLTQCATLEIKDGQGNMEVAIDQDQLNVHPICWDMIFE